MNLEHTWLTNRLRSYCASNRPLVLLRLRRQSLMLSIQRSRSLSGLLVLEQLTRQSRLLRLLVALWLREVWTFQYDLGSTSLRWQTPKSQ